MSTKIYDAELQYLTVDTAKNLGLRTDGLVTEFDEDDMTLEEAGLLPVLVCSVVVPSFRCYRRVLCNPSEPTAISAILNAAWSGQTGWGLPMTLELKPSLLNADAGFADWVRSQGVDLKVSSPTKSIDAFERASRDALHAAQWLDMLSDRRSTSVWRRPVNECNVAILEYDSVPTSSYFMSSMQQLNYAAWMGREKRLCVRSPLEKDWDPGTLKPRSRLKPRQELTVRNYDFDPPVVVEGMKELAEMWPGGSNAFLREIGVRKTDFNFWLSQRAHLDPVDFDGLRAKACLEYRYGQWALTGGYLLVATTARQVEKLVDLLTHGGDVEVGFEVLGPNGEIPSMRIALFAHFGGILNILLFDRSGPATKSLDRKKLLNFGEPRRATEDAWADLLRIVSLRDEIAAPRQVVRSFHIAHFEWIAQHSNSF